MKFAALHAQPECSVSHNPAIRKRVLLGAGDLPHLTGFAQARLAPGQVAGAHTHADRCEVFFVEAGTGTIWIDDTPHCLQPGCCVAVEAGEQHEIANTGTEELVLTYFGLQV
ncbi:MAG: cupin domain-containing protein [Spirulinaceae cyanobacterium RM2_2_10]|nr:cupin domain-containing protein [Spirulinaceae cyanobacterium SM2_1_0]NJO19440.1 cupin domain-containing protein [Spirulinaceae cyanobacterium RM2_2_10]